MPWLPSSGPTKAVSLPNLIPVAIAYGSGVRKKEDDIPMERIVGMSNMLRT